MIATDDHCVWLAVSRWAPRSQAGFVGVDSSSSAGGVT